MKYATGNPSAARALRDALNKALGYPRPGRSAATDEIVDPDRKTGKGWTTEAEGLRVHPTDDRLHAVSLTPETLAALDTEEVKARLTAQELTDLKAQSLAAAELPAEWYPLEPLDVKP